ncbi:replication factor C small subunit domain protein, partial [Teladorsagia circumcincta]
MLQGNMSKNDSIPWVEKYRPQKLEEIVGNEEIVQSLGFFVEKGNPPHFIMSGPPGCGKTTAIWAMARESLGEYVKNGVLELNASDDRGIDVVRNKIKTFCQTKVTLPPKRQKLIILDEADSMTEGAQQALRRIMENYSETTRFALACNQSDKIIGANPFSLGVQFCGSISSLTHNSHTDLKKYVKRK